ncbi:unnamed protein product [Mytilus coruscus]|uniref:Uncharacterized protein n=1 Tax=Mytilus coruscus TaxID=42192 RepID=A0A6J8C614_MYTCO|nr:unnamed protein product [Mytilus coruscus]
MKHFCMNINVYSTQNIDVQIFIEKDDMMSHLENGANSTKAFTEADIKNEFVRKNKQYIYMKPNSYNIAGNTNREEFDNGDVILKYKSKSSKNFIPAFPLSGKPRFLDEWKHRKRVWPLEHVVDDIYNSEFFVVGNPALTKQERKKDFCLAYNNGEIKLARAMNSVQKKVVLILKAIKKSVLQDYSEILTMFHWKTAVYWNSETLNSLLLEDTEDNTIDEVKYEKIPAEKVAEFRKAYNDPSESSETDIIIAILKIFSNESKEKVRAALHDMLTDADALPWS